MNNPGNVDPAGLVLEAARAIRGDLRNLLGPGPEQEELATRLDADLAELLAAAAGGADVEAQVLARLDDLPATHAWTLAFLAYGVPPDLGETRRHGAGSIPEQLGGGAPPGAGEPVRAAEFRCPEGDMLWYRRAVGQPVPQCPTHGLPLRSIQAAPS